MHGLPGFSRAHALSHNGDQPQPQRVARKIEQRHQIAGHRIAGDGSGSQGRNQALEKDFSELKHTVLQSPGNADREDGAYHSGMGL